MRSTYEFGSGELHDLGESLATVRDAAESVLDLLDGELAEHHAERIADIRAFAPVVTVVGQVKAGKTALTNALARRPRLLPSNVNPWTSVVTSLHLNIPGEPERASFRFMGRDDWAALRQGGGRLGEIARRAGLDDEASRLAEQVDALRDKAVRRLGKNFEMLLGGKHGFDHVSTDLIERYVCLAEEDDAAQAGRYADITKSADIYLKAEEHRLPLILRDTPGVNDPFLVREQVTLGALRDTDICILALNASQALTQSDVGLLRILFALRPEQVMIFVNRIDELDAPRQQIEEIRTRIGRTLTQLGFDTVPPILFGSAAWADAALTGDFDALPAPSRKTLSQLAAEEGQSLDAAAWELSGVPDLLASLAKTIGDSAATRAIRNAALQTRSLVQHVTEAATARAVPARRPAPKALSSQLEKIALKRTRELDHATEEHIAAFRREFDHAVDTFVIEQSFSLEQFVKEGDKQSTWSADPVRLRQLLGSAFNDATADYRAAVDELFRGTAKELSDLYTRVSGTADAGRVTVPELGDPPSPVAIGASLAVDMAPNWWSGWFGRHRRATQARKALSALIRREAKIVFERLQDESLLAQTQAARAALEGLLTEHGSVLRDLCAAEGAAQPASLSPDRKAALDAAAAKAEEALSAFSNNRQTRIAAQ